MVLHVLLAKLLDHVWIEAMVDLGHAISFATLLQQLVVAPHWHLRNCAKTCSCMQKWVILLRIIYRINICLSFRVHTHAPSSSMLPMQLLGKVVALMDMLWITILSPTPWDCLDTLHVQHHGCLVWALHGKCSGNHPPWHELRGV